MIFSYLGENKQMKEIGTKYLKNSKKLRIDKMV